MKWNLPCFRWPAWWSFEHLKLKNGFRNSSSWRTGQELLVMLALIKNIHFAKTRTPYARRDYIHLEDSRLLQGYICEKSRVLLPKTVCNLFVQVSTSLADQMIPPEAAGTGWPMRYLDTELIHWNETEVCCDQLLCIFEFPWKMTMA